MDATSRRMPREEHVPTGVPAGAVIDGPWGPVRLAASGVGVIALALDAPADAFRAGLRRRGWAAPVDDAVAPAGPARDHVRRAAAAVRAWLDGEPMDVADLPVDVRDRPAWDRLVLGAVRAIPRGSTASYGEIARRIGRPGAARAVGGAVGRNPVGLLVPCHRVIAGDGTLGGYGVAIHGGREAALAMKRALLALEGVSPG
jgi:methylated-DNA-[protein]-cysteine S-methyltransferase